MDEVWDYVLCKILSNKIIIIKWVVVLKTFMITNYFEIVVDVEL